MTLKFYPLLSSLLVGLPQDHPTYDSTYTDIMLGVPRSTMRRERRKHPVRACKCYYLPLFMMMYHLLTQGEISVEGDPIGIFELHHKAVVEAFWTAEMESELRERGEVGHAFASASREAFMDWWTRREHYSHTHMTFAVMSAEREVSNLFMLPSQECLQVFIL